MSWKSIDPTSIKTADFHGLFLSTVAPRPIAFVSTVDSKGTVNLSPYSFFNAFSTNPPVLVFSPSRRVRDNTTKHTLENVLEHKEVVVNMVNYAMVEQMSLASAEYPKGVNEFIKAGFSMEASEKVQPPRVAEAPAAFECMVRDVISLGKEGGAGNLVICEVVLAHFKSNIFDENGKIDPRRLDPVSRLGGSWYGRFRGESLFEIAKPNQKLGMGFDQLPDHVKNSKVLTGNHLGRLANETAPPAQEEIRHWLENQTAIRNLVALIQAGKVEAREPLHGLAIEALEEGNTHKAWLILQSETIIED